MTQNRRADDRSTPDLDEPLTSEEDDELRRLNYMGQHAQLSWRSMERLVELKLRDRRSTIRQPREFGPEAP